MPDAFGFGAAGQGVGSFLEGLLRGKADRAARESQTRQERLGRVGAVLSLATDLMQRAEAKDLLPEEKNRLYKWGFQPCPGLLYTLHQREFGELPCEDTRAAMLVDPRMVN